MDTFDAINQRRSVKAYDPDDGLTAAEETKLHEAAIQSPTSFSIQNCRTEGWMPRQAARGRRPRGS